eukprot:9987379-Lingulodinium_polyedra.AAC.1
MPTDFQPAGMVAWPWRVSAISTMNATWTPFSAMVCRWDVTWQRRIDDYCDYDYYVSALGPR